MMGDACLCLDVDSDGYHYPPRQVIGRKEHTCRECHRTIPKGAPRWDYVSIYPDQGWVHYAVCLCCGAVIVSLFQCGWFWGMVWEHVRDHMQEMMPVNDDDDEWDPDDEWLDPPTKPIGPSGW